MVDTVLESPSWPVNELGEIVSKRGIGTTNVVGYIPTGIVPVGLDNKLIIRNEADYTQGGWLYIQDGRYVSATPKSISNGVKTKIDFDLSQLAYTAGVELVLGYNETTDRFMPTAVNEVFLASIRFKVKPSNATGHLDVMVESPTAAFNPIVAETLTFSKANGEEHFFALVQPIFISADVLTNGLEIYITPDGTNITLYDYSVFVQKTYLPI